MAPIRILRNLSFSLCLCAVNCIAEAQSIAASLSDYQATLRVASVSGVSAVSFSGVAFHAETKTLYAIDNDNAMVYEVSPSGALLRTIATSGFQDPEGIAYQADDFFFIAEEGLANIVRIKLPRSGSGPVAKSSGTAINLSSQNLANSGIEGVSYRPANKTAYAVKEIDPPRMYRITLDDAGNPKASFPNDPFSLEGKSGDAADIYALNDGNFIIVNQEQNKLEGFGPQGQALSSLPLGMKKPEGIAIDTGNGTIYVVGEPLELTVLKKKNSKVRDAVRGGNGFSCSLVSNQTPGAPPALRYSLPDRTPVHIEYAALNGLWTEVFEDVVDPGIHVFVLDRPALPKGIGFCRFSAGTFHRIVKVVSL